MAEMNLFHLAFPSPPTRFIREEEKSCYSASAVFNNARDEIMFEAQVTKRKHGALKMKAKVLLEEGNESGTRIQECRESQDKSRRPSSAFAHRRVR